MPGVRLWCRGGGVLDIPDGQHTLTAGMGIRVPQKEKVDFAAKLKKWRERRGLSQPQAAKELGVNINTLQNWEIARTMPRGIGLTGLLALIASHLRGK
jgi:DNA-binding transcriptional regulator YiaG